MDFLLDYGSVKVSLPMCNHFAKSTSLEGVKGLIIQVTDEELNNVSDFYIEIWNKHKENFEKYLFEYIKSEGIFLSNVFFNLLQHFLDSKEEKYKLSYFIDIMVMLDSDANDDYNYFISEISDIIHKVTGLPVFDPRLFDWKWGDKSGK